MDKEYRVTVRTHGAKGVEDASTLAIYFPSELRKDAELKAGDLFEIKVVNNKLAIRKSPIGSFKLATSYILSIPASLFEPPLVVHNSLEVNYIIHDEWLCFQIPTELEKRVSGFGLIALKRQA